MVSIVSLTGQVPSATSALAGAAHAVALFCAALAVPLVGLPAVDVLALFVAVEFTRRRILRGAFAARVLLLATAMVTYYVIAVGHGLTTGTVAAHSVVLSLGAYGAGFWAGRLRPGPAEMEGLSGLFAAITGAVTFAFLSVREGLVGGGFEIYQRAAPSAWDSNALINAPALGANLALGMCMLPVALFAGAGPRFITLMAAILAGAAFYGNVALQNRTPFVAAAAALVLGVLVLIASSQPKNRSKVLRIGAVACLLILAALLVPIFDVLPRLQIYERFQNEGLETARYELWLKVLKEMWQHVDGGRAIYLSEPYAHNLWLDVAWDAGPVPFLLLAAFHLAHIRPGWASLRAATPRSRMVLTGTGCALFSIAMAEPVMALSLNYIVIHYYFLGILLGYAIGAEPSGPRNIAANRNPGTSALRHEAAVLTRSK